MFSRFAAALYSAVDALAPPLPLQEDFVWHWKSITKFYTSKNVTNNMPIKETRIPEHVYEMLSILEQEDKEMEPGSIGPCLEYLMDHKLLDTMCVLGTTDSPLGMKRYMLMFTTRLLKMLRQFLIPHVSIYVPINKFIKICGEVVAAPSENEELAFLEAVCDKLTENPHLVNCFMGPVEVVSSRRNSSSDSMLAQNVNSQSQKNIVSGCSECALVSSLLTLFNSPDNRISNGAGECLKTCCSLANDAAAIAIIQNTNLSHVLCTHVVNFYNNVPKKAKLNDIEQPVSSLTEDLSSASHKISNNRRKFLCYLQQLHYFDCLVQQAHPIVSDNLTIAFRKQFLDLVVYGDLVMSRNEDDNLFVTAVISSSLRHLASSKLISAFSLFLLGDIENFEISGHSSHIIKDLLISRCRNTQENLALSMSTLQLFEELLQRPSQSTLHNLVISYVENRGYYDHTASDDWFSFSDNESSFYDHDDDTQLTSSPANATFAPPYIHRILDALLSLLPDDIKSVESEEDSDYDTYIKEARVRFMKLLLHCEDFDWPQEPLTREDYHLGLEDDSSSDSQPEADSHCWHFNEGPFLSMIFDKIEHMLGLPYDINLQVTSIIARLALFTHPNLHEYLLNPMIPLGPGVRTLFSVLSKVVSDIEARVHDLKSFRQKLRITRKALLSDEDDDDYETFPESSTLEVLIIIEEFCKELAAIAFVKYNAAC